MPGGNKNIKPSDGKQFSSEYQPKEKWSEEKALELANEMINWLNKKDDEGNDVGNILFEEFLVIEKGLYVDLVRYLSKKHSSFSELIKMAKKIQEIKITKYGLADRLNSTMAKFILSANHGFSEKKETKTEVSINPFLDLMKSATSEDE